MTDIEKLKTLNHGRLEVAVNALSAIDPDLGRIAALHGVPPLWDRPQGFDTLVRIILEQQVSLASADAVYQRLKSRIKTLSAPSVLKAKVPFLRSVGITTPKSRYIVNVAEAIQSGNLSLDKLKACSDEKAIGELVKIKGIGPWTARVYLLNALLRPDVWPTGDIALAEAFRMLKKWDRRPSSDEMTVLADAWSPHRATAARMLWQYYLLDKKEISAA